MIRLLTIGMVLIAAALTMDAVERHQERQRAREATKLRSRLRGQLSEHWNLN